MAVIFDPDTEPRRIRLEGEIDIAVTAELKVALEDALRARCGVRVALEKTTAVDVTALQLLWAAGREAQTSGQVFETEEAVPETMSATLREAGIDPWLRDSAPGRDGEGGS
jgi:ABC-type transporter Mla MlaB component